MRCSLDKEINKCNFFENELCKNKKKCSFQVLEENPNITEKYEREERWYEKYYRKR